MNEAFKEFCTKEGINPEGDYAREHWITFRAGMLAAAEECEKLADTEDDPAWEAGMRQCERTIREAAKS